MKVALIAIVVQAHGTSSKGMEKKTRETGDQRKNLYDLVHNTVKIT